MAVGHDGSGRPELFVIGSDDQVYDQLLDAGGNTLRGYTLTAMGKVKAVRVSP
jgi:hypothetical protein